MTESNIQSALAGEDICRYLAACYYEPDSVFEDEGLFSSLLMAAELVEEGLAQSARRLGEAFRATTTDALLLDYTRLFLGPMDMLAKPYGSVWLDEEQTLMGNSTMAVLELYQEAEFEMDEEFKELPDHIAAELEFLYLLLFRENEARKIGDDTELVATLDLKKRFLTQHLGAWGHKFTSAIKATAQSAFYRELANLTERFLAQQVAGINK